jgi:hypothetical protein
LSPVACLMAEAAFADVALTVAGLVRADLFEIESDGVRVAAWLGASVCLPFSETNPTL